LYAILGYTYYILNNLRDARMHHVFLFLNYYDIL
jgi:hypothetical protein